MKYLMISLLLTLISHANEKDEYRVWTDLKTAKTIRAKILAKNIGNSKVQVRTEDGRVVWLKSERLTGADNEYLRAWTKWPAKITARVIASRKGYKKLKVVARAGNQGLKVEALQLDQEKPLVKYVAAGKEITFVYSAPSVYWVRGYEGNKLVEEETSKKKTGLD